MSYPVKNVMTKRVEKIKPSQTVFDAAKLMKEKMVGCLIIVEDGNAAGIITERDIVRRMVAENFDATQIQVSAVMSKPLITIDPSTSIRDAATMMIKNKIRRLPVVEDSKLMGIITSTDLAKHFIRRRRTFGSLISLESMPKVGESAPSCQFFKQDPYVPPMQIWKICGACYWCMDERCIRGMIGFLKHFEAPIKN